MESIEIGNLIVSKKGVLKIVFLLFIVGAIIGGTVIAPENGGNWLIASTFTALIVAMHYRSIRKEIKRKR